MLISLCFFPRTYVTDVATIFFLFPILYKIIYFVCIKLNIYFLKFDKFQFLLCPGFLVLIYYNIQSLIIYITLYMPLTITLSLCLPLLNLLFSPCITLLTILLNILLKLLSILFMGCQGHNPSIGGSPTPLHPRPPDLWTPANSLRHPPRLLMRFNTPRRCLSLALEHPCPRIHVMILHAPYQLDPPVLRMRFGKVAKKMSLMAIRPISTLIMGAFSTYGPWHWMAMLSASPSGCITVCLLLFVSPPSTTSLLAPCGGNFLTLLAPESCILVLQLL
jgi:hypothetical protein